MPEWPGAGQDTRQYLPREHAKCCIQVRCVDLPGADPTIPVRPLIAILALLLLPSAAAAQEDPVVVDTAFHHPVQHPAYAKGSGPLVLIDAAHHNMHSLVGFYGPFGTLLQADGYRVASLRKSITATALDSVDVLVISNALPAPTEEEADTLGSAFTAAELDALIAWIRSGGALLLFVDHRPFPKAAADLGKRLGLEFLDGYALDYEVWDPIVFSRARGTLRPHPIIEGRFPDERVDSVATFYGHAMRARDSAVVPLMVFGSEIESMQPDRLWGIDDDTPRIPVGGWLQGAARTLGRGRVVVYGEAGMAVAERIGPHARPRGMNTAVGTQNAQFLLNTLHWLTRLLPESLP
jgi:hypothetical protein